MLTITDGEMMLSRRLSAVTAEASASILKLNAEIRRQRKVIADLEAALRKREGQRKLMVLELARK